MNFNPEYAAHGCTVDVLICPPLYTYDANTQEITINPPGLSIPLNAPCEGSTFQALAGTKFKLFDEKEGTYLQSNNFNSGSFITPRLRIKAGFQITGSGGTTSYNMESALTLEITVDPTKQHLMPKLAEWHIYGNEQQGRFAIFSPNIF